VIKEKEKMQKPNERTQMENYRWKMRKAEECIVEAVRIRYTNFGQSKYYFHRCLDYYRKALKLAFN
jgi:hypothetical protein